MKKLISILTLSVFTLGTFAASASPVMQKDTSKTKKDTTKKPSKPTRR